MAITPNLTTYAQVVPAVFTANRSLAFAANLTVDRIALCFVQLYQPGPMIAGNVTTIVGSTSAWSLHNVETAGDNFTMATYSAKVTASGAVTVEVDSPGTDAIITIQIVELIGANTTTWFDSNSPATGNQGSSTAGASDNFTTSGAGMAFGAITHEGGTTAITPNGAWTQLGESEDSNNVPFSVIYKATTASESVTAQWTFAGSSPWMAVVANFLEAGGGGGASILRQMIQHQS